MIVGPVEDNREGQPWGVLKSIAVLLIMGVGVIAAAYGASIAVMGSAEESADIVLAALGGAIAGLMMMGALALPRFQQMLDGVNDYFLAAFYRGKKV